MYVTTRWKTNQNINQCATKNNNVSIMYNSFEKRDQYKKPNSKMLELRLHRVMPTLSLVCMQASRWEKIQSKSVQFQVEHSGTNSLNSPTPSKA